MKKQEKKNKVSRSYRLPENVVDRLDSLCEKFALKKERIVADAINEKLDKVEQIYGK